MFASQNSLLIFLAIAGFIGFLTFVFSENLAHVTNLGRFSFMNSAKGFFLENALIAAISFAVATILFLVIDQGIDAAYNALRYHLLSVIAGIFVLAYVLSLFDRRGGVRTSAPPESASSEMDYNDIETGARRIDPKTGVKQVYERSLANAKGSWTDEKNENGRSERINTATGIVEEQRDGLYRSGEWQQKT